MKGLPFEVGCRGGSLQIQESRAIRRGAVAWALWRSQITGAGCVFETTGDDATVYLHLRDGRHFAIEEVTPRDCFRLFELLGYEPEPAAGAGRGQAPVVIDLGDRHTRVVSSAQSMTLEQDGRALLTLPCDQLLGVRVAVRDSAAKVQIVTREGFAAQLDGVPFETALRLQVTLGAAPREIVQLALPDAPLPSAATAETSPAAAQPVAEPAPSPAPTVADGPAKEPSRVTSHRRPIVKGSAAAMRATEAASQRNGTRATAAAVESASASDSSHTAHPPPAELPRQHNSSPDPAAPSPQRHNTHAKPTTNGTSASGRDTTAQAIASRTLPATRGGGVAAAVMATTTAPVSIAKSGSPEPYLAPAGLAPAGLAASEIAGDTALSETLLAIAYPQTTEAAAEAEVEAPEASVSAAALVTPTASPQLPFAAPPHTLPASLVPAADARSDSPPTHDMTSDEQGGLPLSTRPGETWAVRGRGAETDDIVSVRQAAGLLWVAVLAAVALWLKGLRSTLVRVGSYRAAHWLPRRAQRQAEAEAPRPATERARTWMHRLSTGAYDNLRALPGTISALRRQFAVVAAMIVLAMLALPTAGDALVVRVAAPAHRGVAAAPVAPRTAAPVPSRDPIPRTGAPASVVYAGSQDGAIYALDAATGVLVWRYDTGSPVEGGPVVVDGVIYAGEADGSIVALRAATHFELWRYHTDGSVRGAPVVVDGVVYSGSGDDHLYALRASDGALLWRFGARDRFATTPTVTGGIVYAGSFDGTLYALRASDGAEVWHLTTRGAVTVAPAIVNGTVYASSSDNTLYALDARTGAIRWRFTTGGSLYAAPVVADGVLYVGSSDTNVYALRASDGALRWSARAGALVLAPAVVAGQTVYVTTAAGTLFALRASDGTSQWRYATRNTSAVAPAVASGTVYVSAEGSSVSALDAQDGTLRWSYRTNGHVTSSLIGVSES